MTLSPTKIAVGAVLVAALIPTLAFATDKAQYCRGQAGYTSSQAINTGTLTQMISYGDCQANFRTTDLANATTRLGQMQKLSTTTLMTLQAQVATTSTAVSTIKTTLDAETATSSAYSDIRSMYTSVRVYALVLRQVWTTAAADRELTIVGLFGPIQTSLTTQVNALPDGTVKTQDQALLADMAAKLTDASNQATSAENGIVGLMPDGGDSTKRAANKSALDTARTMVGTGQTDLQTARQDAQNIQQSFSSN